MQVYSMLLFATLSHATITGAVRLVSQPYARKHAGGFMAECVPGANGCDCWYRLGRSRSPAVPRSSLRTRFRIPRQFLNGSSAAMETGYCVSTLGILGALRVWRGSFHLLSTRIMALRSAAWPGASLGSSVRSLCVDRHGGRGILDVFSRPPVSATARCDVCCGSVCGKSLSFGDCLLAQRLRRTAG